MKQSWVVGSITLWLLIFVLEMMATGGTAFSTGEGSVTSAMNVMTAPSFVNFSGAFSALSTIVIGLGTFFSTFVKGLFLWSPTLFAGSWVWFWQLVCFPISVSFVMVLISIARGVHAS